MKDRLTVEELGGVNHCCGTCLYFNGDITDGEQFCDELETCVHAIDFCCNKWKEKY